MDASGKDTNDDTEELLDNLSEAKHKIQVFEGRALLDDLSEAKHKIQVHEGRALENVSSSNMELDVGNDEFQVNCLISTCNSMQSLFRYIWKGSTSEFQRMFSKNSI